MFTGLVEATGALERRERRGPGYRCVIRTDLGPFELGESISVSGVCLTVVGSDEHGFEADVSLETAEKTTLGEVALGGVVNLERSLRVGDRLGGHIVSGHVDGVARVTAVVPVGDSWRVVLSVPEELSRFVARKGSVALDGVSLTVNDVRGSELEVMLIPHTRQVTSLATLSPGARLNLEVDLFARYVVRQLDFERSENGLESVLERAGFMNGSGHG
jgi:riboflavin synthase